MLCALAVTALLTPQLAAAAAAPGDTIRLEVGAKEVDARVLAPHAARVRVYVGSGADSLVAEWTNELTHGDSAGRPVHRWVTKGTQYPANGAPLQWELRQTFDAVTLAPLGYARSASNGASASLVIDGRSVRGSRRTPAGADERVEVVVDRPGFIAAASDLVPLAVGLREGVVMTAPVWSPPSAKAEDRVFTVVGRSDVEVEGTTIDAWKVEERRHPEGTLVATWYLVDEIPYMVYGEVPMPDGRIRRMTEVAIPASGTGPAGEPAAPAHRR
jgi:hypothetical protein